MDPGATNDGHHYRLISWVLWSMRIQGWLYYKDGGTTLWDGELCDERRGVCVGLMNHFVLF